MKIHPIPSDQSLQGKITVPGDKSISHRALIFGALAEGQTEISGLLRGQDVLSTWRCLEAMGVEIRDEGAKVLVKGRGLDGLRATSEPLDCGNSGTTIRLLMGVLSGHPFLSFLTGDESLRARPMKRVAAPLRVMGAEISLEQDHYAPLQVKGSSSLRSIDFELPVASAQLKSALLLAGLFAEGQTRLSGLIKSRDHTERMLPQFGVSLEMRDDSLALQGRQRLLGNSVIVPGDPSSAAFWVGAALLVPKSKIEIERVSLNPTRTGLIQVLNRMGAQIQLQVTEDQAEPIGTVMVQHRELRGVQIDPVEIPSLIDELPLLGVIATQAQGRTTVRGAAELRVKETDRIEALAKNLRAMGAQIQVFEDGFEIEGPQVLHGAVIDSMMDHRIAMAFSIAALIAQGPTQIQSAECVDISYPDFYRTLTNCTEV